MLLEIYEDREYDNNKNFIVNFWKFFGIGNRQVFGIIMILLNEQNQ